MELKKEHWSKEDGKEFQKYLITFSKGPEKSKWEKRIINTSMQCISVQSPDIKKISSEIAKGNYLEFIDLWLWDNYSDTAIIGSLICKIKDFDTFKKYILKYIDGCDNWATCDSLKFKVSENNKENFYNLACECAVSPKTFTRRLGTTILFKLVDDDNYINKIFTYLNNFENETEYYVNMVNAWLVAECFTKQRDKTLKFLKNHKLNKFTINKAVSKCRDSFRISPEDKEMLLQFRNKD